MRLALALACSLALVRPAPAGELIRELLPADARWLVHLDLEALQRTALYRAAVEESTRMRNNPIEKMRGELRSQFQVDLLECTRSITVYTDSRALEGGVVVLVVGQGADELLDGLKTHPGSKTFESEGRELHAIGDGSDGGEVVFVHRRRFEGVTNQLFFLAESREHLLAAVDVLDGKRASLVDRPDPGLRADPSSQSFLFVETSEKLPGLDDIAPISSVAKLAQGFRFEMSESGGNLGFELVLSASNAGEAQNITAVLQGVSALAGLVSPDHGGDELRSIVGGLRFSTNANKVEARFAHDSLRLLQTMRRLAEWDE